MSVSAALEKSARDFCLKYDCSFDFETFESNVEEFTFLRPISGWNDVYKTIFEKMYMQSLESVAKASNAALDSEAMLDDFEYTLIRPYVNEREKEIDHKPYAGMDRVSRIEFLQMLSRQSPSNSVDLYAEKYKNGELSIKQIRSKLEFEKGNREHYIEIAGCVQALENVNKSHSPIWRVFHPFKNNAEKRSLAQIKRAFIEQTQGGEEFYNESASAAYEPFEVHQRVNATLEQNMMHAREEMNRKQKINDVMRESLHVEGFENVSESEISLIIEQPDIPKMGKQI